MKIRHASTGDTEDWLKLRCALWPEGTRDEHRREIESFLAGTAVEPQAVLLAERDGRIVGFAELSIRSHAEGCTTNRVAFLEGWYVAQEARRLGIGKALVQAAERWAIAQGCTEFASDTQADNELSRAAHLDCGFTEVGVIRCFKKNLPAMAPGR
jgi:aminoglycoside 6'-N-acetyltransferase I